MMRHAMMTVVGVACGLAGCTDLMRQGELGRQPEQVVRVAGAQASVEAALWWFRKCDVANFEFVRVRPIYKSHYGFKALREGRADIACTSRPMAWYELEEYEQDRQSRPVGYRVAMRAFAVYVHPDNPTYSLTAKQFKQVFRKEVTDWSQLGWPDGGPIRLYGPEQTSMGGQMLRNLWRRVMADPSWEPMADDEAIIQRVASLRGALGVAPMGLAGAVRTVSLQAGEGRPAVHATLEAVLDERYVLGQIVYLWTADPAPEAVRRLMEWLSGPAGRSVMAENGYTVLSQEHWPVPSPRR